MDHVKEINHVKDMNHIKDMDHIKEINLMRNYWNKECGGSHDEKEENENKEINIFYH